MTIKKEMEIYLNNNKYILKSLIEGFKNRGENVYTLTDGEKRFTLLYSGIKETLYLYCIYYGYSCLIFSCKYLDINKIIKKSIKIYN